ncbi:hypothetical protein OF83DRAFT_1170561 [Amylostereum chailletii]|nr:hypothetical protein OF83DRAFT_1170561 [Amylostereum chailletii]
MSASSGALSQQVSAMHNFPPFHVSRRIVSRYLPANQDISVSGLGLVTGLGAEAHKAYGTPSPYVPFVVQPNERDIFDQILLEYELLSRHGTCVARQTFLHCSSNPLPRSLPTASSLTLQLAGGKKV